MNDNLQATEEATMAIGDPGSPDELLGTAEAAEVMGVTDAHVRRVIGSGELPARRVGARSWVVRRGDAEAWAKVQRRTGPKGSGITLTASDLREAAALPESYPNIPDSALLLAKQLMDAGATGTVSAGPDCEIEVAADRVTFRLAMLGPQRSTRIEF